MNQIIAIFLILLVGYSFGKIKIFGLELGNSAILLVALVFGHFGFEVSAIIGEIGLILFIVAVGYIAGPTFFRSFKYRAIAYFSIGIVIVGSAVLTCITIMTTDIPTPLLLGMLTGALTSTPGLAAALDATGSSMAATGYGIAYPFGVVGVVLFIQIIPKIIRINLEEEAKRAEIKRKEIIIQDTKEYKEIDPFGYFSYSLAILLGLLIAKIRFPIPRGTHLSLGTTGGPLLSGLILGHFRHVGRISVTPPISTLRVMREFGIIMFLLSAGTNAGNGFVAVLKEYGVVLFLFGALMTMIPMIFGFLLGRKVFKLDMLNVLGSITGGMTSTPSLGCLISVSKSDAPTDAYAATYPVALILVVLACQFIGTVYNNL